MTDRICPARYERPGGRERGDRIVKCHLPAGHPGEHEEVDTEVTWSHHRLDDMPVGPEPVFGLAPTTGAGLQDWGVLTVEQEIRARALDVAGRKFGSFGYDTAELLDTADRLALYIREGGDGIQRHYEAGLAAGHHLAAADVRRRYCEGYDAAIRRLRDAPMSEASREGFAAYLDGLAPDPDDPWADDDPARVSAERSDPSKSS